MVLAVSVADQLQLLTNNYLHSGDREDTAVPNSGDDLAYAWLLFDVPPIFPEVDVHWDHLFLSPNQFLCKCHRHLF